MNSTRPKDVLRRLSELTVDREYALSAYPETRQVELDDETDSERPIMDSSYEAGGNKGIARMINFTPSEF